MAQNADGENGTAARSFAADAHDCIMVRIQTDLPNTSVRREDAPNGELPLDRWTNPLWLKHSLVINMHNFTFRP